MTNTLTNTTAGSALESTGDILSIVRQPLLDRKGTVHGYALLFGSDGERAADDKSRDASQSLLDGILLIGLDRLTGGLPTFIPWNCGAASAQYVEVLPQTTTVLSIPGDQENTPDLLDACQKLKDAGFRLALCLGSSQTVAHPLLGLADYVKVDFSQVDAASRFQIRQHLLGKSAKLVAVKVDTQEEYRIACEEGFTYFQGFYFCHPELIKSNKIPANRLFHMELLRQLQSDPLDLKKVCPLVMRDASLVLRLLRLVNSPLCAIRREVLSVESAIVILGEITFRRMANLAILSEVNGEQPAELLHMALIRARFCQLAAPHCNLDPDEQFLLGMLSLLPAMLRYPMDALVAELPLRAEMREALLGATSQERALLAWVEAHEQNHASQCYAISKTYGLNEQKVNQFFVDAVMWDMAVPRR